MQISHHVIKRLERLSRRAEDTEGFVQEIDRVVQETSPQAGVQAIKRCGYLLNTKGLYASCPPQRDEVLASIVTRYPSMASSLKTAMSEAAWLKTMLEGFQDVLQTCPGASIAQARRLGAYLLALDSLVTSGRPGGDPTAEGLTSAELPLSFSPELLSATAADHHLGWQFSRNLDAIMESAGAMAHHLWVNSSPGRGTDETYSPEEVRAAGSYIQLAILWATISDLYERWRYLDETVSVPQSDCLVLRPAATEAYIRMTISNTRIDHLRTQWAFSVLVNAGLPQADSSGINSERIWRAQQAELSVLFMMALFHLHDKEYKVEEVAIREWIQAYGVIRDLADHRLSTRHSSSLSIENRLVVLENDDFIQTLEQAGLSEESAERVVDAFTLTAGSRDIIDCPLIRLDSRLLLVPAVAALIDPARALLSNLCSRSIDVGWRGSGFEESIRNKLSDQGVVSKRLHQRADGEEFECDAAFVIRNDLFFIEAKAHVQPGTVKEHYEWQSKLAEAAAQLNRSSRYFMSIPDYLRDALGLPASFTSRSVHLIIVTVPMVGSATMIDGCHVIDESAWTRFVSRDAPGAASTTGEVWSDSDFRFRGAMTPHKVVSFLEDPPQATLLRREVKAVDSEMRFGRLRVRFQNFACHSVPFRVETE